MLFEDLLGHNFIKDHLANTANEGRIAHAQLFVGPEGSGTLPMAIAYATHLLCLQHTTDSRKREACLARCKSLNHPDLHFAFPVANSGKVKTHAVSDLYLEDWRSFLKEQPYGSLFDWYRQMGIEKKQGQIGVDEAQDIVKKLLLKSFEGGYKVLIVWMAEKMNISASNKLLKLIEEPPERTVIILVAENEAQIIKTITSRCQILNFTPMAQQTIVRGLKSKGLNEEQAHKIAIEAHGNYNKALDLLQNDSEDLIFEKWFVQWVRSAFKAKGNKAAIHELIQWSEEVAKTGREAQKKFLLYCLTAMRQALLLNYGANELVYAKMNTSGFDLNKFAPFIHENNIEQIVKELETAILHVSRNGNSKIIFTDLSIKLTRLLHSKAA